MSKNRPKWDYFICHATEDKKSIAKPLADALAAFGLHVWYDEFTLKLGDSLSRSIDKGLASAKFGIVILSPPFFAKKWSEYELRGLTARELSGKKIILPVWHGVDQEEVLRFSPPLADKLAIKAHGRSPTEIAIAIIESTNPGLFEKVRLRAKFLEASERARTLKLDPAKIVSGPIRHKELSAELLSRIRLIRASVLGIDTHSMKCWVDAFRHDSHPSMEVAIWERICAAVLEYLAMTPATHQQAEQVFNVALGLANGAEKAELNSFLEALPEDAFEVLKKLMSYNVPLYDVTDCCRFANLTDKYVSRPDEDREHFPVDLPNNLIKGAAVKPKGTGTEKKVVRHRNGEHSVR